MNLNPAGASDLLQVTGTATLNGGTVNVLAAPGTYVPGTTYTIVNAGNGRTGTYGGVTDNLLLVDFQAIYSSNLVQLVVVGPGGRLLTFNQQSVATTLDMVGRTAVGDLADVINIFLGLPPEQQRAALDQLSGELHANLTTIAFEKQQLFLQTLARRLRTAASSPESLCIPDSVADTWIMPFGLYGRVDGDGNAHGFNYNVTGFAVGFDRCLGPNTLVGVALGYAGWGLHNNLDGLADVEAFLLSLHGVRRFDTAWVLGTLAYEYDFYDTRRPITVADLDRTAWAAYGGYQLGGYLEAGYDFQVGGFNLQPIMAVQYQSLWRDKFSEHNANVVNLALASDQTDSVRTFVGGRLLWLVTGRDSWSIPEARALWVHQYVDDPRETINHFQGAPAVAFPIRGVNLGKDFGILGGGLSYYRNSWLTVGSYYDLHVANREIAHSGSAQLRLAW